MAQLAAAVEAVRVVSITDFEKDAGGFTDL